MRAGSAGLPQVAVAPAAQHGGREALRGGAGRPARLLRRGQPAGDLHPAAAGKRRRGGRGIAGRRRPLLPDLRGAVRGVRPPRGPRHPPAIHLPAGRSDAPLAPAPGPGRTQQRSPRGGASPAGRPGASPLGWRRTARTLRAAARPWGPPGRSLPSVPPPRPFAPRGRRRPGLPAGRPLPPPASPAVGSGQRGAVGDHPPLPSAGGGRAKSLCRRVGGWKTQQVCAPGGSPTVCVPYGVGASKPNVAGEQREMRSVTFPLLKGWRRGGENPLAGRCSSRMNFSEAKGCFSLQYHMREQSCAMVGNKLCELVERVFRL